MSIDIQHVDGVDPGQFKVQRIQDGDVKEEGLFSIQSPYSFDVEGAGDSKLMQELRWYLEMYLQHPEPPLDKRAKRVEAALKCWGEHVFKALFDNANTNGWLPKTSKGIDYTKLQFELKSNEAEILSWPWQAIRDPKAGFLVLMCQLNRQLNKVDDLPELHPELPHDCINILLVTARPYDKDVDYRLLSRPLVEMIKQEKLPIHVHSLRPPTIKALNNHLKEHPHFYHIVHFDGHGKYGIVVDPQSSKKRDEAPQGHLMFETENGEHDAVDATALSKLLCQHAIPAVVLNACQSATFDRDAENQYASVATALLKAGVRSVVAMSYSLYASAARQYLPPFYYELFSTGEFVEAHKAGQLRMFMQRKRLSPLGEIELLDFIVPVIYQQAALPFSFTGVIQPSRPSPGQAEEAEGKSCIPDAAKITKQQYPFGFIGRDQSILELERALRGKSPAILVHGMGGMGKSSLVRGLIDWLADTDGLAGCVWIDFREVRTAEYVFNRIGEVVFGSQFLPLTMEDKLQNLVRVLPDMDWIIVWDNFEDAAGMAGTPVTARLDEEERAWLKQFLAALPRGKSKIIITSRGEEDWLKPHLRTVQLRGLTGEERWEYCEALLRYRGITVRRDDPELLELLRRLDGQPKAMEAVLPAIKLLGVRRTLAALRSNLDLLDGAIPAGIKLALDILPAELRELLIPLALYEKFIDADYLAAMAKGVNPRIGPDQVLQFMALLELGGLASHLGQSVYSFDPVLTTYLRAEVLPVVGTERLLAWQKVFVHTMAYLATNYAPEDLREQRYFFYFIGVNFLQALALARDLAMSMEGMALTMALAEYADQNREFGEAERLCRELASYSEAQDQPEITADIYHQLGNVAQERRDFEQAEQWYLKSLAINEKLDDEHGAANTYHQLGRVAEERWDLDQAELWYRKALAINEKLEDNYGAAITYHQLGIMAHKCCEYSQAEQWYRKSLAIKEKLGDEHNMASTYHQLGMVAQERWDLDQAELWYRKALAINEKLEDNYGAAITYHQLGTLAQVCGDSDQAEQWYLKAMAMKEKLGDKHEIASIYHQLGMLYGERKDYDLAEQWYQKSLAIEEKLGNERGAAFSCGALGSMFLEKTDFLLSASWSIRAIISFRRAKDERLARQATAQYITAYTEAPGELKPRIKALWPAELGEFPEPPRASAEG